ncbi:glycoside hydrolase/deacetylase [Trametopsis cervina]|nr:glycoside hydrolase/deacetylase [Trametopsis cervina]
MVGQSRTLATLLFFFALPALVLSLPGHPEHDHAHGPVISRRRPGETWYQRDDHPVYNLFRRDPTTDGTNYPAVGTPEWAAGFPTGKPDPTTLPAEWVAALNAGIQSGQIPNFPPSTPTGGNPTYGAADPLSAQICSTTYKCRKNNDTWDAPDGIVGISFDDGPLPTSDVLYDFLKANDVKATHFFIGINILNNPKEFLRAFDELEDDIALHTWSHPYMTTLTNEQLLGEFGYTMEIIHKSTGGRLPKYWRPPYGDSDNRVSAIAKEIFGLQTVIWNQDSEDWSIGSPGGPTLQAVEQNLNKWYAGPKSPGLIILEHELSTSTVQAFIDSYPTLKSNGWQTVSLAELDGGSAYQNADGDDGTVTPVTGVLVQDDSATSSTASSSSSAASASTSGSASNVHAASPTSGASQTSSSAGPAPSGAGNQQQTSGASPLLACSLRSVVASLFTLFVSALALA